MTIRPVTPDDFETFSIVTNPFRAYSSSSLGVTGSVYLFARRSSAQKDTRPSPSFTDTLNNDTNLDNLLFGLQQQSGSTNIKSRVLAYMTGVNNQSQSSRSLKLLDVIREVPSYNMSDRTIKKLMVKDSLMPYYRHVYPSYNYAFTNYHSLNFFTASTVPNEGAILYPNVAGPARSFVSGTYAPTGAFTFDFYINPRYTTDNPGLNFKAGTIMHLSSTYAISLISGSSKDINGFVDGYRILLQLSHSADVAPSIAKAGTKPNDLIFSSSDNSLRRNHWHHVIIRWGGTTTQHGTGSILIDGMTDTNFVIPSASIAPQSPVGKGNPDVLVIGNYYQGTNSGNSIQARFFALNPATRDGVEIMDGEGDVEGPTTFSFAHPLNAEVHDLLLKETYATDDEVFSGSGVGPNDLSDALFYLPPFFSELSPTRKFIASFGGVLQTPFFAVDGTTVDPFNIALSFGVAGHYLNLENFGLDLARGIYPRWFNMSASEIATTTTASSANDIFSNNSGVAKRNMAILPCDDGMFFPNYSLLDPYLTSSVKWVDDLGSMDRSIISLVEMVPSSSIINVLTVDSGTIFDNIAGPSPESVGLEPGEVLTIFQRTRDGSSNEVVWFDISNMFYGNRILPGTVVIHDSALTGTGGKVGITLKDDGAGNLYRADCATSASQWNSVGNVFYNEGLMFIKNPVLAFFGKQQFDMSFQGEQNIHSLTFNLLAPADQLNSSSNPSYLPVSASSAVNIEDQKFVYLSNVQLHDDNLNVLIKTQFAQPIIKRQGDKFLVRIRVDF